MSKPLGPYTPAVRAGDFIFVSGQLGVSDGALSCQEPQRWAGNLG